MSKLDSRRSADALHAGVAVDALLDDLRDGLQHIEVARRTQSEPTAVRARARSQAALRSARDRLERMAPMLSEAPYARVLRGVQELEAAIKVLDQTRPTLHT